MSYSALPEDYAARALSLCIMQPTVSGGDAGIFRRLHTLLRQLFPRLFSLCSCETLGGGALLLHLHGTPEGQPLVFLSHLDVVSPGDISAWTYPPFGGETHGGYIYGRGAADMKGHLVALLTAAEGLLSEGWQPGGDIWLAFSCDEETRGGSMAAMARLLQTRGVHPAFILDEGGNISQPFVLTRKPFATVGVAEKGRLLFSLSCTAPRALEELSRAAARISRIHPRARLCDPVLSDMLPAMRPLMNGRDRFCLSHGRLFHGSLLHRLSRTATGRAITRTQLSLWKQSGDALLGEIPTLHYSASILPGDSAEALLRLVLADFDLELLETVPVEYRCYCSRDRMRRALISMGKQELTDLIREQVRAEMTCQFCDAVHVFEKDELEALAASL